MHEKNNIDLRKLIKRILSFMKPYTLLIVLCIAASILNVAVALFPAYLIDRITGAALKGYIQELIKNTIYMFLTIAVGTAAKYLVKYSSGWFTVNVMRDIRSKITGHLVKVQSFYMAENHSGDTVSRLTNDAAVLQNFFENNLFDFFYQPLIFAGALVYMLFINWRLLVINIILMVATLALTFILSKPIIKFAEELQHFLGKINSIVQDVIGGIHMLKSYNLDKVLYSKFEDVAESVLERGLKVEMRISFIMPVIFVMQILPFVVCILYGGYLSVKGEMTISGFVTFIYLLGYFTEPATKIPLILNEFNLASAATGRLFGILDLPVERESGSDFGSVQDKYPVAVDSIVFSYDSKNNILDGLSFELKKGKTTALVGHSGCGKSTVLKLLTGFYETCGGDVYLYGKKLGEWDLKAARSMFSIVSQESYLFPASIAENVSYGKSGATFDEITTAAKMANIHDYIISLPEGYQTVVGERGARLSGGQKQRISIARAVLKDAPILLLDEPTSALDNESEGLVQEALDRFVKKDRTVLVIAHRLTTIRKADEILVMNNGRIAEKGTHDELMEKGGIYSRLYLEQFMPKTSDVSIGGTADVQAVV